MVFLDVNPYTPGHTLIVPKEHTLDITTIDNDTLIKVMDKAKEISKLLMDKLGAEGFTLIQNNGFVQEVKHFHLHVIPKYMENKEMGDFLFQVYLHLCDYRNLLFTLEEHIDKANPHGY